MSFRQPKDEILSRARSPEDKNRVREALIAAGRKLFAENPPASVSLRKIAAEAGYAPGTVYQYFANHQELFSAVRAHDMQASTDALRKQISRTRDPGRRVVKLFVATADYWMNHMDDFMIIFPSPNRIAPASPAGMPFGSSPVVEQSLKLYYETVDDFFKTLPQAPMPSKLAADMLMAAVHGTIIFPHMTRTMDWSDIRTMVSQLVTAVVKQWQDQAPETGN